eukprot:sb/3469394/
MVRLAWPHVDVFPIQAVSCSAKKARKTTSRRRVDRRSSDVLQTYPRRNGLERNRLEDAMERNGAVLENYVCSTSEKISLNYVPTLSGRCLDVIKFPGLRLNYVRTMSERNLKISFQTYYRLRFPLRLDYVSYVVARLKSNRLRPKPLRLEYVWSTSELRLTYVWTNIIMYSESYSDGFCGATHLNSRFRFQVQDFHFSTQTAAWYADLIRPVVGGIGLDPSMFGLQTSVYN